MVREDSVQLEVAVLAGRFLNQNERANSAAAIANIFVKLDLFGCDIDCAYGATSSVQVSNGIFSSSF